MIINLDLFWYDKLSVSIQFLTLSTQSRYVFLFKIFYILKNPKKSVCLGLFFTCW